MRQGAPLVADDTVTRLASDDNWVETTLTWLLRYPFLRAVDLAAFCQVSPSTMSRQLLGLRGLERRGRSPARAAGSLKAPAYVEEIMPVGLARRGSQSLYYVSDWGLAALARARGRGEDPASLGCTWGTDEPHLLRQLPRLERLVRTQAFVAGLLHGAGTFLGEQGHSAHGEWDWQRDYLHSFSVRQRERRLTADAAFVMRIRGVTHRTRCDDPTGADLDHATIGTRQSIRERWHAGFVVTDGAIQDWRAAARQLEGFFLYRESPEWWSRYPAFPPLLILAWNARHVELWHALAARFLARGYPPLPGALAVAQTDDLLSAVYDPWRAVWTELGTGRSIRLAQVLAPLPPEALPPELPVRSLHQSYMHAPNITGKDGMGHSAGVHRRARRVVVGNFQTRAARIAAATSAPTTRSTGTDLHMLRLLSLCLGGRHLRLLDTLFDTPGIGLSDLAELLDARPDSLARYLSDLDHHGLLLRSQPSENEASTADRRTRRSSPRPNGKRQPRRHAYAVRLGLSPRGLCLMTARYGLDPRSRYVRRAGVMVPGGSDDQRTSTRAAHTTGIYHFFALVARAARRTTERADPSANAPSVTRLLWWEVGSRSEYRYQDHGRWHNLRPDGVGALRAGERRFHFWLEYDRGTMGQRDLVQKFSSYATYVSSGQWREAQERPLPHLLVVVQDLAQLARMQRAAAQAFGLPTKGSERNDLCLAIPQFQASITLAQRLEEAGPFAAIWWPLFAAVHEASRDGSHAAGLISRGRPRAVFPVG